MVAGDGKDDDLGDIYELLDVGEDAGDKEVEKAYKKASLKCHPDKNPEDPEAAEKFNRLTRAKEILLNPLKRAEIDQHRKAKRILEERFAKESGKRRKFREDLEGRENESAKGVRVVTEAGSDAKEAADEARKRYVQSDFAARIKEREAKIAERQAEVVAEVEEARASLLDARIRLTWRSDITTPVTSTAIRDALKEFGVRSMELDMESKTAMVQLGSREDALRAVVHCRQKKQQLPFRAALEKQKAAPPTTADAVHERETAPERARRQASAAAAPASPAEDRADNSALNTKRKKPTAPSCGVQLPPKTAGFNDWEADMLGSLNDLVNAQRSVRAKT